MKLLKEKILSVFIIFMICFLAHFMYTWFPNFLFSIFFPVNESIWEHLKMLFTSIIIYGFFEYIFLKKKNYLVNLFLTSSLSIPIFLALYLPIYHFTGSNMILNFLVLFVTIAATQMISFFY